ncbi:acyltransferase [Spirosoma soli]|uniref:Acyltransferase n=1 Tax=Spirosoma soli TaxID=1770529 RepID=A0ABW5M7K8_9BACT
MYREHIAWADLLRIIACFLVIVSHACDPFVGQFDNNRSEFLTGALIGSLVRPCVPLFVMISGVLLLPVTTDMATFYARRLNRLLVPFVFWSLMLPILFFLYVNSGLRITNPGVLPAEHTWAMTQQKLYLFLFNFNFDTTALWYVYMLIGLYLFMPILSAWLKQASQKDIIWFLRIWLVSMCVPYLELLAPLLGYRGNFGSMGILGVSYWNAYGTFYYFSGFLGYLVLAYYLVNHSPNWSWTRTLSTAIPLFLIGYAITAGSYILVQRYFPGQYASLEIVWYFYGINVFLMTFSVFIVAQKVRLQASGWLTNVAALSYGVFLSHFIVVQAGYELIYPIPLLPTFAKILLNASFTFAVSLLISWLLSLNKLTRKVVM